MGPYARRPIEGPGGPALPAGRNLQTGPQRRAGTRRILTSAPQCYLF
jgi:hypothetical protein